VDAHEPRKASTRERPIRNLKIEAEGDYFRGRIKPKLRLMGQWLERAGFRPGTRVSVRCLGSGIIELRSETAEVNEGKTSSSDELNCPF
jgi:hypothetical protein